MANISAAVGRPPSQGTANGQSGHPWRFPENLSKPAKKVLLTPEPPHLPVSSVQVQSNQDSRGSDSIFMYCFFPLKDFSLHLAILDLCFSSRSHVKCQS